MLPPSEQANGTSSHLTATIQSPGQQNGDMTLTVLGCGEYVPISQPLLLALPLTQHQGRWALPFYRAFFLHSLL